MSSDCTSDHEGKGARGLALPARGCAGRGPQWCRWLASPIPLAAVLAVATAAQAEGSAAPAPTPVGDTAAALPGVVRVGVPGPRTRVVALALSAGYGLTEAQARQTGPNHRAAGTLAAAAAPVDWLALGLRFDGRYDVHPADADGNDASGIGEPRLTARVGQRWGAVRAGAEVVVWLPGGDAPAVDFAATTVDARGLFALSPGDGATTLASLVGYRLDHSAATESAPDRLRLGDRLSLGVSDFDALLLGLGVSQRVGATEVLGEVSADWLLGAGSPGLGRSPVRVTAGVRHPLSTRLAFEALAEVVPTSRPSLAPDAPLAPLEPRCTFTVGLRSQLLPLAPLPLATPPPVVAPPPPPVAVAPEPPAPKPPPDVVAPAQPVVCSVAGSVVDEGGAPIVDAAASVQVGGQELSGRTDAAGHFELRGALCGAGTLTVQALDFDAASREVVLSETTTAPLELLLRPAVPAGELRGLVRGLDGQPIAGRIALVGTTQTATTNADGSFSLQLPPGSYTVEVTADGFAKQRRAVKIDNRGVTIFNADLRPGP